MSEQKRTDPPKTAFITLAERDPGDPATINMAVTGNPAEVIEIVLWEEGSTEPVMEADPPYTVPNPAEAWEDSYPGVETSTYTLEAENGDYAVAVIEATQFTSSGTATELPIQITFPPAPENPELTRLRVVIRPDTYQEGDDVFFYKYTVKGDVRTGNHSLSAVFNERSPGRRGCADAQVTPSLVLGHWVAEADLLIGGGDPFALLVRYRGHNYAWKLYPGS